MRRAGVLVEGVGIMALTKRSDCLALCFPMLSLSVITRLKAIPRFEQ